MWDLPLRNPYFIVVCLIVAVVGAASLALMPVVISGRSSLQAGDEVRPKLTELRGRAREPLSAISACSACRHGEEPVSYLRQAFLRVFSASQRFCGEGPSPFWKLPLGGI